MRKFLTIILLAAAFIFPAHTTFAAEPFTMNDLVNSALENDVDFQSIRDDLEVAGITLSDDKNALMPKWQFGYRHYRQNYLDETTGRYNFETGLSYPLRDGGRRKLQVRYDSRRISYHEARITVYRRTTALDVIALLADYLSQKARMDVLEHARNRAADQLQEATAKVEAGDTIELSVLEAEAHLAQVETDLKILENSMEVSCAQIAKKTALPCSSINATTGIETITLPELTIDEAMDRAPLRPDYVLAQIQKNMSENYSRLAQSYSRTSVDLTGGYRFSGQDISLGDKAWNLGVAVTYDLGKNRTATSNLSQSESVEDQIFQGGVYSAKVTQRNDSLTVSLNDGSSTEASIRAARLADQRQKNTLEDTLESCRNEIREAYYEIEKYRLQTEVLEKKKTLKEKTLEARHAEFNVGLATMQDLVEAEEEVISATIDLQQAQYALLLAERRYIAAIGLDPAPASQGRVSPPNGNIEDPHGLLLR